MQNAELMKISSHRSEIIFKNIAVSGIPKLRCFLVYLIEISEHRIVVNVTTRESTKS